MNRKRTLAAGASRVFTFIYNAGATTGVAYFTGSATATDTNNGAGVVASEAGAVTITVAPNTPVPTSWPKQRYEEYMRAYQQRRAEMRAANAPEAEMGFYTVPKVME